MEPGSVGYLETPLPHASACLNTGTEDGWAEPRGAAKPASRRVPEQPARCRVCQSGAPAGVAYCLRLNFKVELPASHLSDELNMEAVLRCHGRLRLACFCLNQRNQYWLNVMSTFCNHQNTLIFLTSCLETHQFPKLDLLICISFLADQNLLSALF